ncbi:Zinc finger CCHC domain-containing protein 9-like [Oopsacas minuta]|uniref:Zinc finger CCHC domain-containing protein 9-like n=1 Tax=Oopsacas minuta TaxID=111878 RepID=A0AAV7JF97_9METZ|nr:Zinc finger CCHC domain-containing protein 9-like [Oopsacas minuta]
MGRTGKLKVKKTHLEGNTWGELKSAPKKPKRLRHHNTQTNEIPPPGANVNSQNLSKRQREIIKRRLRRKKQKTCFSCRNTGHLLSDCPFKQEGKTQIKEKICYICGSPEHISGSCHLRIKSGEGSLFQFAKCFICKQTGHISKQCPQNSNGIYPNGGACRFCGSKKHLKGQCPERKRKGIMDTSEEFLDKDEGQSRDVMTTDNTLNTKLQMKEQKTVYF